MNIIINDHEIELSEGNYSERNAQAVLLAGHLYYATQKTGLAVSDEALDRLRTELDNAEAWLSPAVKAMGELISAVDTDELEDRTLEHAGYMVANLMELLDSVRATKQKLVTRGEI